MSDSEVPALTCMRWRARVLDHDTISEVADDSEYSKPTVYFHVRGECSHTGGVERDERTGHVGESTCHQWRERFRTGETAKGVSRTVSPSYGTVCYHVFGECSHSPEEPPCESGHGGVLGD